MGEPESLLAPAKVPVGESPMARARNVRIRVVELHDALN